MNFEMQELMVGPSHQAAINGFPIVSVTTLPSCSWSYVMEEAAGAFVIGP